MSLEELQEILRVGKSVSLTKNGCRDGSQPLSAFVVSLVQVRRQLRRSNAAYTVTHGAWPH
jgi:hypothetical protein